MTSKSRWGTVVLVLAIVVFGGGGSWLIYRWFQSPVHTEISLRPSQQILQREADDLRTAIEDLKNQVQVRAIELVQEALKDDYWSLQDTQEVPKRVLGVVESIKASAPYVSLIEGFTFSQEADRRIVVTGFSYSDNDLRKIVSEALDQKPTAVIEKEVIDQLELILRQQTQYNGVLEDTVRNNILRFITTPEEGKKAGLSREVAINTIIRFCKVNHIRTWQKQELKEPVRDNVDRSSSDLNKFMLNLVVGPYIVIIATHSTEESARREVEVIRQKYPEIRASYNQSADNKWPVSIGGSYSLDSAQALQRKAINLGLRSDTYYKRLSKN